MSIGRLGVRIERPDLHAGDALLEQRLRQLVGAMQEGVEVLVGPCDLPSSPQFLVFCPPAARM